MESRTSLHQQEIEHLLDILLECYGYDFRNYTSSSIHRRIQQRIMLEGYSSIAELQQYVQQDPLVADRLLKDLSINVTEMFRDPEFFLALRTRVFPLFKELEHIKIWSAGCATGEEVFSLAILLKEMGLYDRSLLYATDFNKKAVEIGHRGIIQMNQMKINVENYHDAGGQNDFADYYHANYNGALLDKSLRKNIHFSFHDLTGDDAFMDLQMITCRNVLIYFNSNLQQHVLALFAESLCDGGFLCLGPTESLRAALHPECFETFCEKNKIYRKTG
jgi:chemotaxis protein methyltransferase CheR